jgi:hypothetical protein
LGMLSREHFEEKDLKHRGLRVEVE